MTAEKLAKIRALAERGIAGEKEAARKILERHGAKNPGRLTATGRRTIIAMEAHNRDVMARLGEEHREWVKKFRIIRYNEHTQEVLFMILPFHIEEYGLRLYTTLSESNTFYCLGPNVCYSEMPYIYAGWHARKYREERGLGMSMDDNYWHNVPGRSMGMVTEADFETEADAPFELHWLDEEALNAMGIELSPGFRYVPGREPYIASNVSWLRIISKEEYLPYLLRALESTIGREQVYIMPSMAKITMRDGYFVENIYCNLKEVIVGYLQEIWVEELGKSADDFHNFGLAFWNARYRGRTGSGSVEEGRCLRHLRPIDTIQKLHIM